LVEVEAAESSDLPSLDYVPDEQLPECIASADGADLEAAARLQYWHFLNHPYRDRYRQHRDAEEAATKAAWVAANPDRRTFWDKLRGHQVPRYSRPSDSPFTQPAFEATGEQRQNMTRLSEILLAWRTTASRPKYTLELAELYRELGRFEEADMVIQTLDEREVGVTSQVIAKLIQEKQLAPTRYRM